MTENGPAEFPGRLFGVSLCGMRGSEWKDADARGQNMSCENQILSFIRENFLLGDGAGIQPTQSLLGSGVIDSTGILELVLFIEKTFGIQVMDAEMIPSNLDSISHIAGYVQRKQASADVTADEPCLPECTERQALPGT